VIGKTHAAKLAPSIKIIVIGIDLRFAAGTAAEIFRSLSYIGKSTPFEYCQISIKLGSKPTQSH